MYLDSGSPELTSQGILLRNSFIRERYCSFFLPACRHRREALDARSTLEKLLVLKYSAKYYL